MEAFWTSWRTPLQAVGELTFPHLGSNTPEERDSFLKTSHMLLQEAKQNPDTIYWAKCTEKDTKQIVGSLCYYHEKNWPEPAGSLRGFAFPPGSDKQILSDRFYDQLNEWRSRLLTEEHAYGLFLVVLPDYRATGAGAMLLDFGLKWADEKNLEAFAETTIYSTPMLLRRGFRILATADMNFPDQPDNEEWTRLVHNIQQHPLRIFWRPRQGIYNESQTWLPTTKEAKL